MITVNYTPSASVACPLGRQMENEARQIVIDLSGYISDFGEGTAVLIHRRPSASLPYNAATTQSGSTLSWVISNTDTAYKGRGEAELRWYVGDVLAKSVVFATVVKRSITEDVTIPEELESWYDAMIAYLDSRFDALEAEIQTGLAKTLEIEEGDE